MAKALPPAPAPAVAPIPSPALNPPAAAAPALVRINRAKPTIALAARTASRTVQSNRNLGNRSRGPSQSRGHGVHHAPKVNVVNPTKRASTPLPRAVAVSMQRRPYMSRGMRGARR
jgi:hypothetical protein